MLAGVPVSSHLGSASPLQHINPVAASLIQKMLQTDPTARPTIHELLNDEFFTSGYIPARLPITCLTIPPRFSIAPSSLDPSSRKPLTVLNKGKAPIWVGQTPESPGALLPAPRGVAPIFGSGPRALLPLGLRGKRLTQTTGPKKEEVD